MIVARPAKIVDVDQVTRTALWGEPAVRGVCRWCGDLAPPSIWSETRVDADADVRGPWRSCRRAGHRLAINVSRVLRPEALRRAFTLENLRWLCYECHWRKTRLDRALARYIRDCSMDWRRALRTWRSDRRWPNEFLGPLGMVQTDRNRAAGVGIRRGA